MTQVSPRNIWTFRQNRPSLVMRDLEALGVPHQTSARILMARGVFKWFACRRDLIRLKNHMRDRLTALYHGAANRPAGAFQRGYRRGYIKALEQARSEIRAICHSQRWRAPDIDQQALDVLEGRRPQLRPAPAPDPTR